MTPEQRRQAIYRCLHAYLRVGNNVLKTNMKLPSIGFDAHRYANKAAGIAWGTSRIAFNEPMMNDCERSFLHILNDTVPHELAHSFNSHMFGGKSGNSVIMTSHGFEWQEIMRRLGRDPHKFHDLDCASSKRAARVDKNKPLELWT